MKKITLLFICLCACLSLAAAEGTSTGSEVLFVNNQPQEFTALVGQMVKRTGLVRFADAEIPPDPNPPVVRVSRIEMVTLEPGFGNSENYWLTLEGADCNQFTARIMTISLISNQCTVAVTYAPHALGTHTATLKVNCPNAGVPLVTIPLRGEATGVLGDLDGDGLIDVGDVTGLVGRLLSGDSDTSNSDIDGDGQFNVGDITLIIRKLLSGN